MTPSGDAKGTETKRETLNREDRGPPNGMGRCDGDNVKVTDRHCELGL